MVLFLPFLEGTNHVFLYICTTLTTFVNKKKQDPEGKVKWNLPMNNSVLLFLTTYRSIHNEGTFKQKRFLKQLIRE